MVALKKGGIIIKFKIRKALLNKEIILVQVAILSFIIFYNTTYNINTINTEVSTNEIKIVEEIDTSKLSKNNKKQTNTTSRSKTSSKKKEKTEQKYTKPKNVTISKNMDLTKRTGLSKKDFKKVIKNLKQDKSKFFYNNSDTIYDLCKKYQINEFFFCGLISAESGWNIASNHRRTHNYISLMSNGTLIRYSSTKEGLEVAAKKLHQNYLTPGGKFYSGKTIAGVQKRFCPASSTWDDLVYNSMKYLLSAAKMEK